MDNELLEAYLKMTKKELELELQYVDNSILHHLTNLIKVSWDSKYEKEEIERLMERREPIKYAIDDKMT